MLVLTSAGAELDRLVHGLADRRTLLGISGSPGAGKSTLAAWLAEHAGAVVVPMDGFHLPNAVLEERGLRDRKGAPETFDAEGYADLLTRIARGEAVRAPAFEHAAGEAVPGAIDVPAEARLVVTEGNYLLLPDGQWPRAREQLDAVWHVITDEPLRLERLLARAIRSGKDPVAAGEWLERVDGPNARLVEEAARRTSPDQVLDLTDWTP